MGSPRADSALANNAVYCPAAMVSWAFRVERLPSMFIPRTASAFARCFVLVAIASIFQEGKDAAPNRSAPATPDGACYDCHKKQASTDNVWIPF
jgi:hypothetical protein